MPSDQVPYFGNCKIRSNLDDDTQQSLRTNITALCTGRSQSQEHLIWDCPLNSGPRQRALAGDKLPYRPGRYRDTAVLRPPTSSGGHCTNCRMILGLQLLGPGFFISSVPAKASDRMM
ncbi:uncharacterized protein LOC142576270 [Dermacentor variabilis]|uniref:uncharacterized protein LOC142576270 n=1 Tax=Dermacentor variabilis TaxID=34621 RepID=UPI003F5C9275